MIECPERHIAEFANAGADAITVHHEATPHVHYALGSVRAAGCLAGLAINPATAPDAVAAAARAGVLDLALCMTVNPGWGGQPFIPTSLARVARVRELVGDRCAVQVDGGVDTETARACRDSGANLLVAGSAIFAKPDPAAAYRAIAAAAED